MTYEWSVNQTASPSEAQLQETLNELDGRGYEIHSIFAIGHSLMVVARKRLPDMDSGALTPEVAQRCATT